MITDVLYSVNMYIPFCVERFELSHVIDIALYKCYALVLLHIRLSVHSVHSEREGIAVIDHCSICSPSLPGYQTEPQGTLSIQCLCLSVQTEQEERSLQ